MKIHRLMSAGSITILVLSSAVFCLFPISSYATVDWQEGFEYTSKSAQNTVWASSCANSPDYLFSSTERPHIGARSLKMEYTGNVGITSGFRSCFMDRNLVGRSTTLYTRIFIYMTGSGGRTDFIGGTAATKIYSTAARSSVTGANTYPGFWWLGALFSNVGHALTLEGVPNSAQPTATALQGKNITGGGFPQNQWVCMETRVSLGSPGQANGIIQTWINGQPRMNSQNERLLVQTQGQFGGRNSPYSQFAYMRLYVQNGIGIIYVDDFAVSRDARIGCGSSVSDPTPPNVPNGVVVR